MHLFLWYCVPGVYTFLFLVGFLVSLVHQAPQTFDDATRTSLPLSPQPPGSPSNFGSPCGYDPDFDGLGGRPSHSGGQTQGYSLQASAARHPQSVGFLKLYHQILAITNSSGTVTGKFAELEQNLGTLAARILALEATMDKVRFPHIWLRSRMLAFVQVPRPSSGG